MSLDWQGRDNDSSGHARRIAGTATPAAKREAWHAFFEHATDCDDCRRGRTRCEEATKLLRAWRTLPS